MARESHDPTVTSRATRPVLSSRCSGAAEPGSSPPVRRCRTPRGRPAMFVIGEAFVDLVGPRGGRTLVAHPGGSPANVALGLARLGDPVTLVTRLGRDAFGEMISRHLQGSGWT